MFRNYWSWLGLWLSLACALPARAHDAVASRSPFVRTPSAEHPATRFQLGDDTDRNELTLYVQREVNPVFGPGGSAETGIFEPLCALPCEVSLRSGSYVFGLSDGAGPTLKTSKAVSIRGGEHLRARYDSRRAARVSGWLVLVLGVLGGGALILNGHAQDLRARFISGNVVVALSLGAGLWLANLRDRASLEPAP